MLTLEIFTDPMMGLSYQSEPFIRYLETHFTDQLEIKNRMGGLVRDVFDWVNPADLILGEERALDRYNQQLGAIYRSEEDISGLPMDMRNCQLFSLTERSSTPLNLAYKTVELLAPERAENFLYRLRFETIVGMKQTTKLSVLIDIASQFGLDPQEFETTYHSQAVQQALEKDWRELANLNIRGLPLYRFTYKEKTVAFSGVLNTAQFLKVIDQFTTGDIKPQPVSANLDHLNQLIQKHPLISPQEIMSVYDLAHPDDVRAFIQPLLDKNVIQIKPVYHGWFIEKTS